MHVVIAGFGIEGKASAQYFAARGHRITIIDEQPINNDDAPENATIISRPGIFESIDDIQPKPDMVIRTAGLAPRKLQTVARRWSATNEFFQQCPAPVIGVTGSKGKGTTASFIASILRASGKTVHLVGNIGVPALDILPDILNTDIVVYELSSFQLWDAEYSPHIAVVLHMEPDHLDVHESFEEYIQAKSNIVAFQNRNDICVYHPTNQFSEKIARKQPSFSMKAAKYDAKDNGNPDIETAYVNDGNFVSTKGRILCATDAVVLPGVHNLQNAAAAISACLNIDPAISNDTIAQGLSQFTGLRHRLKFVREVAGVRYYDDSIATTPGSAIAAANSFSQPKVMILGGSAKGADFAPLAQTLADVRLRHILLIGDEAERIAAELDREGVTQYEHLQDVSMADVVGHAQVAAKPGDVVILSPACASFGMFKNYSDRGDQFIAAVDELNENEE